MNQPPRRAVVVVRSAALRRVTQVNDTRMTPHTSQLIAAGWITGPMLRLILSMILHHTGGYRSGDVDSRRMATDAERIHAQSHPARQVTCCGHGLHRGEINWIAQHNLVVPAMTIGRVAVETGYQIVVSPSLVPWRHHGRAVAIGVASGPEHRVLEVVAHTELSGHIGRIPRVR